MGLKSVLKLGKAVVEAGVAVSRQEAPEVAGKKIANAVKAATVVKAEASAATRQGVQSGVASAKKTVKDADAWAGYLDSAIQASRKKQL